MAKKNSKKLGAYPLRVKLIQELKKRKGKSYTVHHLRKKFGIKNSVDMMENELHYLKRKGMLSLLPNDRWTWVTRKKIDTTFAEGEVDLTRSGAGYIVVPDMDEDVYIPAKRLAGAMNGDRVRIEVYASNRGRKPEGSVVEIIQRARERFLGIVKSNKRGFFVQLDARNNHLAIQVERPDFELREGAPAIVHVTRWKPDGSGMLFGQVDHMLSDESDSNLRMQDILLSNGFNIAFPPEVIAESESISEEIPEEEIRARWDYRDVLTFTVDPVDAKDFDDAISIREVEDGNLEVGVHIADVSHYVQPNSALDREALKRSTSVYLVDRVCPMLPERLSNKLCSLRPHEDKLAFSAIFTITKNYKILKRWFGRTIINSDHRFTYEEAQELIEGKEHSLSEAVNQINALALHLQKKRFKNGSIAFESEEVRFILDENGVPIETYAKERKAAHMMIEDLMLLANKEVAIYIAKRKGPEIPFVYRIHDEPDPAKVSELANYAKEMGVDIRNDAPGQLAESFNNMVKQSQEDSRLKLLMPLAIRTMSKAEYSPDNIGHYGLAFEYYAHFTSPIRRYADVLVHRILFQNIGKNYFADKAKLSAQCEHISKQERKAMKAERESIKYKQVEFISKHVGDVFDGVVSGMIDQGIFVELLPSRSEGMIRMDQLPVPYSISSNRFIAKAQHTHPDIHMGDAIKVRVLEADLEKQQIELELADFVDQ